MGQRVWVRLWGFDFTSHARRFSWSRDLPRAITMMTISTPNLVLGESTDMNVTDIVMLGDESGDGLPSWLNSIPDEQVRKKIKFTIGQGK